MYVEGRVINAVRMPLPTPGADSLLCQINNTTNKQNAAQLEQGKRQRQTAGGASVINGREEPTPRLSISRYTFNNITLTRRGNIALVGAQKTRGAVESHLLQLSEHVEVVLTPISPDHTIEHSCTLMSPLQRRRIPVRLLQGYLQ